MRTSGRDGDRGISLVILLVGIVIVGLVSTVIVIGVRARDPQPTAAECEADRSVMLRAEQRFHTDHLRYGTEDQLVEAGLLDKPLALHDVTLAGGSFEVIGRAACAVSTPGATASAAPVQLALAFVPDVVTAGRLINPPITVTLTDEDGAALPDSTAEVTIRLEASNGAKLSGTTAVHALGGVATFADLAIDKAGSGYSFVAATPGGTVTSATTVTVNPGSAARLRFLASPGTATPGAVFATQPVVEVEDVMGNVIADVTEPIALAITRHTGASDGRLACDNLMVVPTAGVAPFGGCQISAPGTDYSLTATTMGLSGRSDTFAVIGSATKLVVVQQPAPAVAGAIVSPTIVAVEDSAGNVVTDITATLELTVNQNSESLTGTMSIAVVDGIATFADLALSIAASDYTFTIKADGLKSATSEVFEVITGSAAQLVFTRQPNNGRASTTWTTQPIVTVEDALGNVVVTSSDAITLQLTPNAGSPDAVLVCAENPVIAVFGEAEFSKCSIDRLGEGFTLIATSGSLSVVSNPFAMA